MPPPRRATLNTPKKGGKLTLVKDASDMQAILDKNEEHQLLLIYYGSAAHAGCKGFRKFLLDLSAQPSLRNVAFVEVDLDQQALREVGMKRQIQVLPTVEAWKGGKCLEAVKSGAPAKVLELLDRHFDESKQTSQGEGSPVSLAKAVIAAGAVCALGFLVQRQRRRSPQAT